ncbi:MAG: hypothetical protein ABSC29_01745 [Minisyncoccia bacterium]|jgi:hypothetical protein
MSNPELYFKNKTECLEWFHINAPDAYEGYLATLEKIKQSNFPGKGRLSHKATDESIKNFLTFQTELNLANLLLTRGKTDLAYEPAGMQGVDFSFDDIFISVKSLTTKRYEKVEHEGIEAMRSAGGGKNTFQHKKFSDTHIEVEKNEMGTYTQTRTEIGHGGFLDSDIAQMSRPLEYIGEFEGQANAPGHKKVLFFFSYSAEFKGFHGTDAAAWYFDVRDPNPIFRNDPSWYLKLMRKDKKIGNIDALIFAGPPLQLSLIWPPEGFQKTVKGDPKILIYTKDQNLKDKLLSIFIPPQA